MHVASLILQDDAFDINFGLAPRAPTELAVILVFCSVSVIDFISCLLMVLANGRAAAKDASTSTQDG